jgi:glycosyltransferase involved in cell wall biosynthesis
MPSAFYPSLGGVEELTSKLAGQYESHGHSVALLTNQWPSSLSEQDEVGGQRVYRIPFLLPEKHIRALFRLLALSPVILIRLVKIVREFRPEMLHVICCSGNLPYAIMLSRMLGIAVVVTAQGEIGMDAAGLYQSDAYVPRNFCRFIQQASWVTACSSNTRKELLEYSGTALCEVIHNGIDITEFEIQHENPRLATGRPFVFAMGRHVYQKGFDVLIRAWHQLQLQDYDLVIGGSGSDTEKLMSLIHDLELTSSVHLIGRLDRVGVVSHLQHAACFVLPSRHEPFGIVVLEAMAARAPVIATEVGGVPEFVTDGVNGRLVPGNDVNAMAQAIKELIVNGASETQISAGHATAVEHDWSSIATEYLNIYSKCIAGELQV